MTFSLSAKMAPSRTKTNKSVEINRADFSIFKVKLFKKDRTPIPRRTGKVTMRNMLNAMPVSEMDSGKLVSPINPIDMARTIGTLTALNKLITAVRDTESATSPRAKYVRIFDVTPPGAAAISITPIAISMGRGQIITKIKPTIGKNIN